MRAQLTRVLLVLACLAFGLAGVSPSAAAAAKKKKHHKTHHHKSAKPAAAVKAGGAPAAAPAEEDDDDEGDESAEGDDKEDDAKAKPKSKAQTSGDKADKGSDDEREASGDKGDKGDDEGESTTVRRKRPVMEAAGGAPVALELAVGPRALHRTFDFNDPLSDHQAGIPKPYAYKLNLAPAPFVDLALYPAAFATRGLAASFGIVARYEKLVATKTTDANGASFDTLGQQIEVGLRGRLPLGEHEVGLTVSGGKHTFHVTQSDPGPAAGSNVPNVDYTFAGIDADARLRLSPLELGAHVGTRLVFDTGSLGKTWFSTTKTTSIEAGVSVAYKLTPMFSVVAGADFLRYAFDFNPITAVSTVVAGGAVDQYISGFVALRVSLSGS